MTWVFNRTRESLPMVMLLHASTNSVFSLVWPVVFPDLTGRDSNHMILIAATAAALVLLAATRGRLGRRTADADAGGRHAVGAMAPERPAPSSSEPGAAVSGRSSSSSA